MMSESQIDRHIAALVEQFKQGALLYDEGCESEDQDVQWNGIVAAKNAVNALDTLGPEGRDVLIPLMNDGHPGIRVYAAGYLLKHKTEQAVAVLKEVEDRCLTRTHMTAFHIRWAFEHDGSTL